MRDVAVVTAQADVARGQEVKVAVLDSGWDRSITHERVLPGVGLVDAARPFIPVESDDDCDRHGHGTACIDIVLRTAPRCHVVPVRVLGSSSETSPAVLLAGLLAAGRLGADVISLSLSTERHDVAVDLYEACAALTAEGRVVVASAANKGGTSYPAVFDNVIGVTSWDSAEAYGGRYLYDASGCFECAGGTTHVGIRTIGGRKRTVRGTSFATPVIAGMVAEWIASGGKSDLPSVRAFLCAHATATAGVGESS